MPSAALSRASRAAAVTPAAVARPAGVRKTRRTGPSGSRAPGVRRAAPPATSALAAPTFFAMPEAAQAAVDPVASAFAAYGHYLGLVLVVASLTVEKMLIKPMTEDEAQKLVVADSVYMHRGHPRAVHRVHLRVTQYGKGWDFYSHEPIFWSMALFGVMGSSSLFNTIKIIQIGEGQRRELLHRREAQRADAEDRQRRAPRHRVPIRSRRPPWRAALGTATDRSAQAGAAAPGRWCASRLTVKYVKEAITWEDEKVAEKVEA